MREATERRSDGGALWARAAALLIVLAVGAGVAAAQSQAESNRALGEALAALPEYRFGDDRTALTVIAERVAAAADDETRAAQVGGRLSLLLTGSATDDAKRFICRQLALVGGPGCVPLVAPMLENDAVSDAAADALQRIDHESAGQALIAALDRTTGRSRLGVINAIGERRDAAARPALIRLADDPDAVTAVAAIAAIGKLGDLDAANWLEARARAAGPAPGAADQITDALLICAERLHASGDSARAAALFRLALDRTAARPQRMAALRGLVETGGRDPAKVVKELFGQQDPVWDGFACELVRTMRRDRATRAFGQAIPDLPDDDAVRLIAALAERGDTAALPALTRAVGSTHDDVRRAAIVALGAIGDRTVVPTLTSLAASRIKPEAGLAREGLRRLRAADTNAALAARLGAAPAPERVEIVSALGDRHASEQAGALLALLRDEDDRVRRSAYAALARIGRPEDLRVIIDLVVTPAFERERALAAGAAVSIGRRDRDAARRTRPMLAAMERADVDGRRALLRIMGRTGGEPALQRVRMALDDPGLRKAAITALSEWPDDAPATDLLDIATTERDTADGRVALHGYVRLASLPGPAAPEARLEMLGRAMGLSGEAADRRLVLDGLSGVAHPGAIELALPALDDPALGDAAARAIIAIAGRLDTAHRDEALAAIEQVLARRRDPDLRRPAGEVVDRLEADRDFITAWAVAGPYTAPDSGATELFDIAFLPERPSEAADVAWHELAVTNTNFPGRLDLNRAIGGDNRCAYVRTTLHADRARKVRLEMGSDDGIKAWLNGEVVHANNALRGLTVGSDRADVTLREGENTLMLKITEGGGDWGFACRIRDPWGFHAQGVQVADPDALVKPPAGAVVLFDGRDALEWTQTNGGDVAWATEDGALVVRPGTGSVETRAAFGDCILHVGFMIPAGLGGTGQGRGNSGVYLQRRYEVQILESSGDEPLANGCGAVYGRHAPRLNAARPPGAWQSYLIDFTAPRYDGDGAKLSEARLTVWHNGYLVQDDVAVAGSTGAGAPESIGPGPLLLQDHGQPIRFRDIWIVEKPPSWEGAGAAGFEPLFDGRSLDGWRRLGGKAEYHVADGQIVGVTRPNQPNTFLCTERTFDDFVLELQFLVHPELNSGVQVRSNSRADYHDGRVHGYQVEIDPSERAWSAGIYDEGRRGWLVSLEDNEPARRAFIADGWNRLRVEARGDEIRTWLNDVPAARLVDSMTREGFIGLQVHGVGERTDPLEVRWRDVRIRLES